MGISEPIISAYNDILQEHGTDLLVFSGTTTFNSHGDADTTFPGSAFNRGILRYLSANELSFLPEGSRKEETFSILFKTTAVIDIGDKLQISGNTTKDWEVIGMQDEKLLDNATIFRKITAVRI
ncbi:hypothetical protein LCGC14_2574330 [marine sediment metagenome]|uniref:Uncharacterized protein n=1 Tax=marine sediment metagenome TaxID=412755 RepID=A0A0F9AGN8_9ZZZZ|nr:hypothetical protein [Nitrosopumilus sp.]